MVMMSVLHKNNKVNLKDKIKKCSKVQVLVGIPSDKNNRNDNDSGITNAELLYIHTHGIRSKSMRNDMKSDMDSGKKYSEAYALYVQSHGSPIWSSPPRPVIEPAIKENKKEIAELLGSAISLYLKTGDLFSTVFKHPSCNAHEYIGSLSAQSGKSANSKGLTRKIALVSGLRNPNAL